MPKKKKKRADADRPKLEWSVDPETAREVIAVILVVSGAIFLLSVMGLAANFGRAILGLLQYLFGWLGFFLSIAFIKEEATTNHNKGN